MKLGRRKHLKKISWIAAIFLILVIPSLLAILLRPNRSEAAWFNDSWAYRKSLAITHNASVTNTVVKFDIATDTFVTNGQIQSDCGDSRFTDANGNLLPYFIDTAGGACNTNSTDYYVFIPQLINGTVYIYH